MWSLDRDINTQAGQLRSFAVRSFTYYTILYSIMKQYVIVYYIILHEKLDFRADTDRPNAMSMLRAVRHEPGLSNKEAPTT